jgi:hypothetical protein
MQLVSLSINPIPSGGMVADFEGYDGNVERQRAL